jgi:hypothetical protein
MNRASCKNEEREDLFLRERRGFLNERAFRALELVVAGGYPLQLACWIVCGMNSKTYGGLKHSVSACLDGRDPCAEGASEPLKADTIDIAIRGLKIRGLWRDMPKPEYREMLADLAVDP